MSLSSDAFHRELRGANAAIVRAGALVHANDGDEDFSYIDTEKMPRAFLDYYSGLLSAGYANGYI